MKKKEQFVSRFVLGEAEDSIEKYLFQESLIQGTLFLCYYLTDQNCINMIFHTVLNNKQKIHSDWIDDDIINLNDPTFVIPKSYQYEIIELSEKYIARPDLLSLDVYGDALYSDLLCKLNGVSNPFELNKGMLMVIPSPDVISEFMKTPTTQELDSSFDDDTTKPLLKTKKDKRKANEAVVGDTRFKIDKTRGIVIY